MIVQLFKFYKISSQIVVLPDADPPDTPINNGLNLVSSNV